MKIIIVFFVTLITYCIDVDSVSYGDFLPIKEIPYLVSLEFSGEFQCGGAIISEFFILTAAHCMDEYTMDDWDKIKAGRSVSIGGDGSQYDIDKIYIYGEHENGGWDSIKDEDYQEYDIALIKLKDPIVYNEYQQPIKISSKPPMGGDKVTICGFGSMGVNKGKAPSLRRSEVTVIDREECKPYSKPVHVPKSLFCAGNGTTDVCAGDSGSPAIINGELAGIVSSGPDCHFYPVHDRSPGLYTRVDLCYNWIMKVTGIKN